MMPSPEIDQSVYDSRRRQSFFIHCDLGDNLATLITNSKHIKEPILANDIQKILAHLNR